MTVTLRPITLAEAQQVRVWRNDPDVLPMLRTGYKSPEEQEAFWRQWCHFPWWKNCWWTLRAKERTHRYYAIDRNGFVGIGGLTYIKNREAEISLVLGPSSRRLGIGSLAVDALLEEAWRIGLVAVIGECYATGNVRFWSKQVVLRPEWTTFTYDAAGSLTWRWEKP